MLLLVLYLVVLVSPPLVILWGAIARFGFAWSLLLIPIGAIAGAVFLAVSGACCYEYSIRMSDRIDPPPAGSLGASTGRGIMTFVLMAFCSWLGSGLGAWLVLLYYSLKLAR